jgi:hypothetical protein
MTQFKVGDRVRRVRGSWGNIKQGDTGTVSAVFGPNGIRLGGLYTYAASEFELVSPAWAAASAADPTPPAAPATARKDDSGKLDMNLLDDMPRALKAVVEVMQWAIADKKPVPYVRGSWLGVHADRYRAAIKRHDRSAAEQATADVPARFQRDAETDLLHLAHTACSAMMALENTLRELENSK